MTVENRNLGDWRYVYMVPFGVGAIINSTWGRTVVAIIVPVFIGFTVTVLDSVWEVLYVLAVGNGG